MKKDITKQYNDAANAQANQAVEQVKTLDDLRAIAESLEVDANAAIAKKKITEAGTIIAELTKTVEQYNDLSMRLVFSKCRDSANPKLEAAKTRFFDVIDVKVKKDSDTKLPEKVELSDGSKMIDLLKFCEFAGISDAWWTTVEAYAQFFALQNSSKIGVSEARKQYLIEKFKISKDAKKVDMTRFSNSEKVAVLQQVIDEMVFVPGRTEGMNALRVNNYDVEYLNFCSTKEGKQVCSVNLADGKVFRRVLTNVCYRLAISGVYSANFKEIKPKKVPTAEVASEKVVVPAQNPESKTIQESEKKEIARVRKPRTAKKVEETAAPAATAE